MLVRVNKFAKWKTGFTRVAASWLKYLYSSGRVEKQSMAEDKEEGKESEACETTGEKETCKTGCEERRLSGDETNRTLFLQNIYTFI